jgi:N-formylglutamate amidohydrolase
MKALPEWVILHIPHDAVCVPESVRDQCILTNDQLEQELVRITDHCTLALFAGGVPPSQVVRAAVSRLVVDVERFEDDALEKMAGKGMGAIYTGTSQLTPLRRKLSAIEREALLAAYYRPHHARLSQTVGDALAAHGKCLILDCHSFPDQPLPYEMAEGVARPDICIGTDDFHTPVSLREAFVDVFEDAGFSVKVNSPFSGAMVPATHHGKDGRVQAVMVEVNRRLYLDESSGKPLALFPAMGKKVTDCCRAAILIGAT